MDRLILIRHGKTEARATSGEDFDRQLTERGRRDVQLVAEAMIAAGLIPDRVLVSAAVRTRQTWDAMSPSFPEATLEMLTGNHIEALGDPRFRQSIVNFLT